MSTELQDTMKLAKDLGCIITLHVDEGADSDRIPLDQFRMSDYPDLKHLGVLVSTTTGGVIAGHVRRAREGRRLGEKDIVEAIETAMMSQMIAAPRLDTQRADAARAEAN